MLLVGNVEEVTSNQVAGWAHNAKTANAKLTLDILVDGEKVGTCRADQFRQDLKDAGVGDGAHGFVFAFPAPLAAGEHEVLVQHSEDQAVVFGSGKYAFAQAPVSSLEGNIDSVSETKVTGWAWLKAQPLEQLFLDILVDGEKVGTCRADRLRQDLKDAGVGDGAHGFVFAFPAPQAAGEHEVLVQYSEDQAVVFGSGKYAFAQAPVPSLEGNIDSVSETKVTGWAWLKAQPLEQLSLDILVDGEKVGTCRADRLREDLKDAGVGDGAHGFVFAFPTPLAAGEHEVSVQHSEDQAVVFGSGKYAFAQAPVPSLEGNIDSVSETKVTGWAWLKAQPLEQLSLDILVDGEKVGTCRADQFRQDLKDAGVGDGAHGFVFAFPAPLAAGEHEVSVQHSEDQAVVFGSGKYAFAQAPVPSLEGNIDSVSETKVTGWAWLKAQPLEQLSLDILVDGEKVGTCRADRLRQDLKDAGVGDGAHGFVFAFPAPLAAGEHEVSVQHSEDQAVVFGSGKYAFAQAPVSSLEGNIDSVSGTKVTGWAWLKAQPLEQLSLDILVDGEKVGTCRADRLREDLKGAGAGDGAHGFVFAFPAPLAAGEHEVLVQHSEDQAVVFGSGKYAFAQAPVPSLEGNIDSVSGTKVTGWAWLEAQPLEQLSLDILVDGEKVGTCRADQFRQDLKDAGVGDGCHAFVHVFSKPVYDHHQITVQMSGYLAILGVVDVVGPWAAGQVTSITAQEIRGWAIDFMHFSAPIEVVAELNGAVVARAKCTTFDKKIWEDYGGHGFYGFLLRLARPLSSDDIPNLQVKITGVAYVLPMNDGAVKVPAPALSSQKEPRYQGYIDQANPNIISGWIANLTDPSQPVELRLFVGGLPVGTLLANQFRSDLQKKFPASGGRLGFSTTLQPTGGLFQDVTISLRTADTRFELSGSPSTYRQGPPGQQHAPALTLEHLQRQQQAMLLPACAPNFTGSVAIIILNRNGAPLLQDLLESFHAHNTFHDYELIVIDHGSIDASPAVCNAWRGKLNLRFVSRNKNYSYSESNNYGAALTEASHLLFLNNDIIFQEDVLPGLVGALDNPDIGMVGLRLETVPSEIEPFLGTFSNAIAASLGYQVCHVQHLGIKFETVYIDRPFLPFELGGLDLRDRKLLKVPGVTGAAMMLRRADFEAIGGFHEGYYYGYEDVDLSLSVRSRLNKEVVCANYLRAWHHRSASLKKATQDASMAGRRGNKTVLAQRVVGYLAASLRQQRKDNEVFLRGHLVRVGLLVSEVGDETDKGDYFTAKEFAEYLVRETGYECYLVPRKDWNDLQMFDVAIALVEDFNPQEISRASPSLQLILWVRNWFDRAIERPWLSLFDQIWVSSEKARRAFSAKTTRPVHLMRIATNPETFGNGTPSEALRSDYCFTGSYFGSWRQIISCLAPAELPYQFALFGHGWKDVVWLHPYYRGPLSYAMMADVYASSRIVIDDANHTTIAWGSVNSRVFDAIASGCLVLTNSQAGSDDCFDGLLPVYNSKENLHDLLDFYLSHEAERLALVEKLQEKIFSANTYQHRAQTAHGLMAQLFDTVRCCFFLPSQNNYDFLQLSEAMERALKEDHFLFHVAGNRPLEKARQIGADVHIVVTDFERLDPVAPRGAQVTVLVLLCDAQQLSDNDLEAIDIVLVPDEIVAQSLRARGAACVLACSETSGIMPECTPTERKIRLRSLVTNSLATMREKLVGAVREALTARQTVPLAEGKDQQEVIASEKKSLTQHELRIAYVLWDYPALSQTFVLSEIRWLVEHGFDVNVYYKTDPDKAAEINFDIAEYKIENAEELKDLLQAHHRNVIHSPFAYPATTLLTYPAATECGIPFTFMPAGVDIAHYGNQQRNKVDMVSSSPLCLKVITIGECHKQMLLEAGVPANKIILERQSAILPDFQERPLQRVNRRPVVASIGRFIEKKGFTYLIDAAQYLPESDIRLYGYGPLEEALKQQAAQLGLDNVFFCGPLRGREALMRAYHEADVFVLPSVRAEDGDMDGLPTVLVEAMAAGVPVVSTDVANIPDLVHEGTTGFLCRQHDGKDLAEAITRVLSTDTLRLRRMLQTARSFVDGYASVERTMHVLLDIWTKRRIDIVLVTHDTGKYRDWPATQQVIQRIYDYTSMPFNLIVVDNKSDADFLKKLHETFGWNDNFNLISLEQNLLCGPASNIGIRAGSSDYIFYICSKEGYVLKHGWERELVRFMDERPDVGMAGHLAALRFYYNGKTYLDYPEFPKFRNQSFAMDNPERTFRHVQGGLYILRRKAFEEAGPFNDQVPQNGLDVEYSYFLESCGWKLASIPHVYCQTTKTLPKLSAIIDEFTLAAHPLSPSAIIPVDDVLQAGSKACNICGWTGAAFSGSEQSTCPACGASAFSRTTMRLCALSGLLQRTPRLTIVSDDGSLVPCFDKLCAQLRVLTVNEFVGTPESQTILNPEATNAVIIDHVPWRSGMVQALLSQFPTYLHGGGVLILGENSLYGHNGAPTQPDLMSDSVITALRTSQQPPRMIRYSSQVFSFDWLDIATFGLLSPYEA